MGAVQKNNVITRNTYDQIHGMELIPKHQRWIYKDNILCIINYLAKSQGLAYNESTISTFIINSQSDDETLLECSDRLKKLFRNQDKTLMDELFISTKGRSITYISRK